MPFAFLMPKLSPTMEEGAVAKWLKKEGEFVQAGEVVLEIATDKATVEHQALDEGYLRKILVRTGVTVPINEPLAVFTATADESIENFPPPRPQKVEEKVTETPSSASAKGKSTVRQEPLFVPEPPLANYSFESDKTASLKVSPLAKKLAQENKLDITSVKGTGPGGRVESRDLEGALSAGSVVWEENTLPEEVPGSYEELPLSPIRRIIARRLQESKSYIPHFYIKQEINAAPAATLREHLKNHGLKITITDLIIRATALALRSHSAMNSGFNSSNQTIIRFKTIDISIAVDIGDGLVTPIIRHADFKPLHRIATELKQLSTRAKAGKLKEEEYKGGSFCLSNLGMFGISEFTAVINPPQAAILAIGAIIDKPVLENGLIIPGKTLTLTLSVDHRVIDGTTAAHFLKTLQKLLENPSVLLI